MLKSLRLVLLASSLFVTCFAPSLSAQSFSWLSEWFSDTFCTCPAQKPIICEDTSSLKKQLTELAQKLAQSTEAQAFLKQSIKDLKSELENALAQKEDNARKLEASQLTLALTSTQLRDLQLRSNSFCEASFSAHPSSNTLTNNHGNFLADAPHSENDDNELSSEPWDWDV